MFVEHVTTSHVAAKPLKNAYIKFASETDSAEGFDEIIKHSHCSRLSNDIYCVPWESLAMLDARDVNYTFATDEDIKTAQPIWNISEKRPR